MGISKEARAKTPPPRTRENDRWHAYAVCDKCRTKKKLTEFHKNGTGPKYKASDPRRYKRTCAECLKTTSSRKADRNFQPDRSGKRGRPRIHKDNATARRLIRRKARIKCLEYLASKGCEECGIRDPRVLEFDHIDPSKKTSNVATLLSRGYTWASEILRREIRKCRILCANCHRLHTIKQQGHYSHDDIKRSLQQILSDIDVEQ